MRGSSTREQPSKPGLVLLTPIKRMADKMETYRCRSIWYVIILNITSLCSVGLSRHNEASQTCKSMLRTKTISVRSNQAADTTRINLEHGIIAKPGHQPFEPSALSTITYRAESENLRTSSLPLSSTRWIDTSSPLTKLPTLSANRRTLSFPRRATAGRRYGATGCIASQLMSEKRRVISFLTPAARYECTSLVVGLLKAKSPQVHATRSVFGVYMYVSI